MKKLLILLFAVSTAVTHGQDLQEESIEIWVAPQVDTSSTVNQQILERFQGFVNTKNRQYMSNPYWVASDFERFVYPYYEIIGMEYDQNYQIAKPVQLLELFEVNPEQYLVKFAYANYDSVLQQSQIVMLYNIMAVQVEGEWFFKRAVDYLTRDWTQLQKNNIKYYLPPGKTANIQQVQAQLKDVKKLSDFFELAPFPITYYSCNSPVQLMQVKGFDYVPSMYVDKKGGFAAAGNMIYSGNNSEYYTHEVVHLYVTQKFPKANRMLNEGLATYLGGSGTNTYDWHKENLKNYLTKNELNLYDYLEAYRYFYIEDETPVSYMVGALVCQKILEEQGKAYLFELLANGTSFSKVLEQQGIDAENMNDVLLPYLE